MAASLFRRERSRFLTRTTILRQFSQVITANFDSFSLHKRLVDRLASYDLINATEIQQKSLGPILNGGDVIVNSETGSGKTLCYLLPIINRQLMELNTLKNKNPSALILVPNMHLGFQIAEVFNKLCDPGYYACPVSRDMSLRISNKYPVIISTIDTINQYSLPLLLPALRTVVIDEADMIIANNRKTVWKLLNTLKNPTQNRSIATKRQFIFVAATMPARGEKSVLRKITKWSREILHVTSDNVHRYVATVTKVDVEVNDNEKLPNLAKYLNNIFKSSGKGQPVKVLIFVNTASRAKNVFDFLNSGIERSSKETGSCFEKAVRPWDGRVGVLYKDLVLSQRQLILEEFKEAKLDVLVTTDLGSRGLDVPRVSHVIQMDYAQNAIDVLHRAGRTARAGEQGTVINFVTEEDKQLLMAVQESEQEDEGFQKIFSRNRMFSKRINRKKR